MSKTKLENQINQAQSFNQIAQLLKRAGDLNSSFLERLYQTYHVRYNQRNGRFESDLDHPGIFYDCTYKDVKECVNNILEKGTEVD